MDEIEKELWIKMIRVKCQYCKHYMDSSFTPKWGLAFGCDLWTFLPPDILRMQKCPNYEWDNRLTKEDFIDYG